MNIAINATIELRGINGGELMSSEGCQRALGYAITEVLGLQPNEGFEIVSIQSYFNQIYDYNFFQNDPDLNANNNRRNLGATQGSWGASVTFLMYGSPSSLGFSDDNMDGLYHSLKQHLLKSVSRNVLTSVVISKGRRNACPLFNNLDGITLSYFSNDYMSTVLHSGQPSSRPTYVIVASPRNTEGVLAATIVGFTSFIMVVMYFAQQANGAYAA